MSVRIRKYANGSVPKLASGASQAWADGVDCCCGAGCPIGLTVQCEVGETARFVECSGRVSVHVDLTDIDTHAVSSATDFTSWTYSGGVYSGMPYFIPFLPIVFNTTASGQIDGGLPTPAPNANWSANQGLSSTDGEPYYGYRIQQTVNGSTETFDVRPTAGFTLSTSHSDFNQPSPGGSYTTWTVGRDATFTETIYELYALTWNITRHDGAAHPSDLDGTYGWQITYYRDTLTLDHITSAISGGSPSMAYTVATQRTNVAIAGGRDSEETVDSETPCATTAFDLTSTFRSMQIGRSGYATTVYNLTADTSKTATFQFTNPDIALIGCRDCARTLAVTGSFKTTVHPTLGNPFYDPNDEQWLTYNEMTEEWEPGPDAVVETVTFAVTLRQDAVGVCDSYSCRWTSALGSPFVITTSGGDFDYDSDAYTIARVSPIWYQFVNPTGTWDLKLSAGDCPTSGTWTVRQDPNPHGVTGSGGSQTYDVIAPYTDTFTSRTISITGAAEDAFSPAYFCDEGCAGASDDYAISVLCGSGNPPDGEVYIEVNRTTGCHWEGTGATYGATLDWADSTWTLIVTRNSDSVVVFTATWGGSPSDPSGSHGFDSSIWDEAECTAIGDGLRAEIA